MVACFRCASIYVHSVYLPPSKLEFNYDNQEWIQCEANEVSNTAEFLFTEMHNALQKLSEKLSGPGTLDGGIKTPERSTCIEELEAMLLKDREEFQGSFLRLKPVSSVEKLLEIHVSPKPSKALSSSDSALVGTGPNIKINQGGNSGQIDKSDGDHPEKGMDRDFNSMKEAEPSISSSTDTSDKSDSLESGKVVQKVQSEGELPNTENISETLEATWSGEGHPATIISKENGYSVPGSVVADVSAAGNLDPGILASDHGEADLTRSPQSALPTKKLENLEKSMSCASMPFPNFYSSYNKNSAFNPRKVSINERSPVYVSSFMELERQSGARLLLPLGVNDTVVPVYDDEPTSIIAYALVSSDYHSQMSESERPKDAADSAVSSSLFDSINLLSFNSFSDVSSDAYRSFGSGDDSILSLSGSGSLVSDPLLYTKDLHARVSFTDDGPLGKVKYSVTCYHAKRFESLRRTCCPSEMDFVRSLSRCRKWGAQGGKSNVFFAKTLDDRFIIKQVTKTELESFVQFGPAYFKYLFDSINTRSPTCLAKILGIYQVSSKHLKGGKELKMDVLVMENLLFGRHVTRLYDLKGSSRSRYNPDTSGSNKVLLDQNLIEAMPTPRFLLEARRNVCWRGLSGMTLPFLL